MKTFKPTICIFLSVFICISSYDFVQAQENNTDSMSYYQKAAQQAVKDQNYLLYQQNIEKIIKLTPDDYMSRLLLARAYVMNGNKEKAIEQLIFLAENNYDLIIYVEKDKFLNSLQSEPKFKPVAAKIKEMKKAVINSSLAFSIKEKDLIPESIAYDPFDKTFYLGSFNKGKIIKVGKNGKATDFAKEKQDGLLPTLGVKIDEKRRHLWIVSSFGFKNSRFSKDLFGQTGVFKYSLKTGKLIKKYMLPQKEGHLLNDLVINSQGDVFITDSFKPAVYKISVKNDTIEKFIDLEGFPNGIELAPDESKLFVVSQGIYIIDIKTKKAKLIKHPPKLHMRGDGMYFYKNSLIIIQGPTVTRVVRIYLNDDYTEVIKFENLEINNPIFNAPTTGVIVKNAFYFIANSQVKDFDEKGEISPLSELEETQILKIKLK